MVQRRQRRVPPAVSFVFVLATLASRIPLGAEEPPASKPPEPREVRAVWITRWDFRTEDDVRRAIRWCAGVGLNRIFLQVRGRADAFYRSSFEPWGEELGGEDPGFDPLTVALEEARTAGVALDAWINVMPGWKGAEAPRSPDHLYHKSPEWFLTDRAGNRLLKNPHDYTILNPCLPEVRAYLVEIVKDIAHRYPVHGVQLDYLRFLGRDPARGIDFPYDPRTLQLFRKYSGRSPFDDQTAWNKWRGLAMDALVYRLAEAARAARPGLRLSIAAIEDYRRAREDLFQDVVKWQQNSWIDEVFPMTYHRDEVDFLRGARPVTHVGLRGAVFPGIGAHLHESAAETVRQIELTRSIGAGGYAIFAYSNLFPSASHESRRDERSKRLRAELRQKVLELNSRDAAREPARATWANPPRS